MAQLKVVFLFDRQPAFPPDYNNMKCYYVSEELARRKIGVIWLSLGGRQVSGGTGIAFAGLDVPSYRLLSSLLASFSIAAFCLAHSVRTAYVDGWFYSRDAPFRQLATILTLRVFGVRVVVDQRDPYLDFEVARGKVRPGSLRHKILKAHEKVTMYACNLFVVPSRAYERLLRSEGAPDKVRGTFRGIDLDRFNPSVGGGQVRAKMELEGKFVVGWFGMMYPHREVKEVLIPLAESMGALVPEGRMIIGGRGPLERDVQKAAAGPLGKSFAYVGAVAYSELPGYLAACDLLLCPIDAGSRFARHSNWLKILEGLAVGVPVVATRTEASVVDLSQLSGVVWTGQSLADFQAGVRAAYRNFGVVKEEARAQARSLRQFGIESTIPKLVDWILQA